MADAANPNYDDATYYGPDPGAGSYGILQAQAEGAYSSALTDINSRRSSLLSQSGMQGIYDQTTGNFTGFNVDANNQNGGYQQLENNQAYQGAQDDAAIAGMGFGGGLATQAHEQANRGYSQNAMDFASNVFSGLNTLQTQGINAYSQMGDSLYSGLVDNITAAINAGTFNPGDYTNVTLPGYGDGQLTQDDLKTLAGGLGWGGTTTSSGGGQGSGPGGGTGGGTTGANHPHYDAFKAAHPNSNLTFDQWVAKGRPR